MAEYILTDNILELIGNTPLLQLKGEPIFAKAEFLNPGSGETLQGVGKFLSEHKTDAKIIAVEPKNVFALLGHEPGRNAVGKKISGNITTVLPDRAKRYFSTALL